MDKYLEGLCDLSSSTGFHIHRRFYNHDVITFLLVSITIDA